MSFARACFAFGVVAIAASACKKDDLGAAAEPVESFTVAKQHNPNFFYFGATWCSYCGSNGKPVAEGLYGKPKYKDAGFIFYHLNDEFSTPQANTLSAVLGVTGYPTVSIDGGNYGFSSNKEQDMSYKEGYLDRQSSVSPLCNTQIKASTTSNSIDIEYKTKFWESTTDSIYVNIVAVESNLYAVQQGQSGNAHQNIHDFVYRAQTTTKLFGDFVTAKAEKDQIFKKTAKIAYNPLWKKENMHLIAVVWRKNTFFYTIVNTDKIKL